jgi:putative ABC transport system permease protein
MFSVESGIGLSATVRVYRWLLLLYPSEFRAEYGALMVQAFRDRSAARRRQGFISLLAWWLQTLFDVMLTAPGEHMDVLFRDLKYAIRSQVKNPVFTIVAVLALALGIGANSAIFTIVNAVLLRVLPYQNPERLVMIWENMQRRGGPEQEWTSPSNFADWRDQNQVFDHLIAFNDWGPTLTDYGEPEQLQGGAVSHDTLEMLGVSPVIGRTFAPEEDRPGAQRVAILGDGLWKRRFGSDPSIVGRTIMLDGEAHTVIGVLPSGFNFPFIVGGDIWRPLTPSIPDGCTRGCIILRTIARMKPGMTLDRAQTDMSTIARRLEEEYPGEKGVDVTVVPLRDQIVGPAKPALLILLGAVGFVLVIACANVANLLLARSTVREKEISIRMALGASRQRLIRQLLTESVLLGVVGGAVGLALAYWTVRLLVAVSPPGVPRIDEVSVDGRVLAFTLGIAVLTGLVFGLVPAFQTTKPDLNQSLKEGGRDSRAGAGTHRLRSGLVVAEVALALMLLIGAGLLFRSFGELNHVDPGFNPANLLTVNINLPPGRYSEPEQIRLFYRQLFERLGALPGVKAVSGASSLPLGGRYTDSSFIIEGRPIPPPDEVPAVWYSAIAPDYFNTMGMRLLEGREFNETDQGDSSRVVIINETMARRHWPTEDPVGKRISGGRGDNPRWREIVGVVKDVKHFGLDAPAPATMYLPLSQVPARFLTLVIRTQTDPATLAPDVRREVWALDSNLAVTSTSTMDELVAASTSIPRFITTLLVAFASLAVVLAAVGIYGVMAYGVAQRSHEIGIRMALGAGRGHVVGMIVRQGMLLTGIGVAIGLGGALALTRLMRTLLFAISATDAATFVAVPLVLVLVALVATSIPAARATRVDPMQALRCE